LCRWLEEEEAELMSRDHNFGVNIKALYKSHQRRRARLLASKEAMGQVGEPVDPQDTGDSDLEWTEENIEKLYTQMNRPKEDGEEEGGSGLASPAGGDSDGEEVVKEDGEKVEEKAVKAEEKVQENATTEEAKMQEDTEESLNLKQSDIQSQVTETTSLLNKLKDVLSSLNQSVPDPSANNQPEDEASGDTVQEVAMEMSPQDTQADTPSTSVPEELESSAGSWSSERKGAAREEKQSGEYDPKQTPRYEDPDFFTYGGAHSKQPSSTVGPSMKESKTKEDASGSKGELLSEAPKERLQMPRMKGSEGLSMALLQNISTMVKYGALLIHVY